MTVMSLRWLTFGVIAGLAGCASGGGGNTGSGGGDPLNGYGSRRVAAGGDTSHFATIYTRMGLAASGAPLFFVGDAGYFATPSPDTTLVVVGLSLPNRGLIFTRDQGGYSASYGVDLSISNSTGSVAQAHDSEAVRVTTFRETSRTDESVIYRRGFRIAPGSYSLAITVRDNNGQRVSERQLALSVPRLGSSSVSSVEPVYEATPRTRLESTPSYLPAPRASYVFGVDDSASMYMESYDQKKPVSIEVRTPAGDIAWQGTRTLTARGSGLASGVVTVPLSHADVGIGTITASQPGSADTVNRRIFIGFGPDLPVLSFTEMLRYLRFFRDQRQLQPLYTAKPNERGVLWRQFLRETDPNPNTPQNEALDDYFNRIREANSIFVSDFPPGWLSDRGMVFVALGTPSNAFEDYAAMYGGDIVAQGNLSNRVRVLVWDYSQYQTRIIFYDPNDTRQWRLTRPSMSVFQSLLARLTRR